MAAPPVVRFLDFGQFKYEATKREKEAKRKQRSVTFKEVRLKPKIATGDFDTRVRRAIQFLEEGDRLKVAVQFRGRELTHPEIGRNLLARFADRIKDHGVVERAPLLEGKSMHITVASTHKPKAIEAPKHEGGAPAANGADSASAIPAVEGAAPMRGIGRGSGSDTRGRSGTGRSRSSGPGRGSGTSRSSGTGRSSGHRPKQRHRPKLRRRRQAQRPRRPNQRANQHRRPRRRWPTFQPGHRRGPGRRRPRRRPARRRRRPARPSQAQLERRPNGRLGRPAQQSPRRRPRSDQPARPQPSPRQRQESRTSVPKMKSHKAAAKRIGVTGSGKIVRVRAWRGHHLEIKSSRRTRRYAGKSVIGKEQARQVRRLLPYL